MVDKSWLIMTQLLRVYDATTSPHQDRRRDVRGILSMDVSNNVLTSLNPKGKVQGVYKGGKGPNL